MNWIALSDLAQLNDIYTNSFQKPVLIFKHSTRCALSSLIRNRLEKEANSPQIDYYILDLIMKREISNEVSQRFAVYHESPQVILIKNGECIYEESHNGIYMDEIINQL